MLYSEIRHRTRQFRKHPTDAEKHLWQYLRRRKRKGKKFLRQFPIIYESIGYEHFFFVADFYCASERLIIELDGPIHKQRIEKDERRDEILHEEGYRILRIRNEELKDMHSVLTKIDAMLQG